jgi:hypothetical protein
MTEAATVTVGKAVPVTGCEGRKGCERRRSDIFLEYWLRDGGDVVSLMR